MESLNWALVARQWARQAEVEAFRATDDGAREVFVLVAELWRALALEAAREHKRGLRAAAQNRA